MLENVLAGLNDLSQLVANLKSGIDAQESMTPADAVNEVLRMETEGQIDINEGAMWVNFFTSIAKVLPLLRKCLFGLLQRKWTEAAPPPPPEATLTIGPRAISEN